MIPLNICCIVGNGIRNTKVDQFQLTFHQNEVRWFKVRMYYFLVMNDLDSLQDLRIFDVSYVKSILTINLLVANNSQSKVSLRAHSVVPVRGGLSLI